MPVHRQKPGTARGVVFLSLEDEAPGWPTSSSRRRSGSAPLDRRQRERPARARPAERLDGAVSLLATRLERLRGVAAARSRDFR
jgi:hypothetical protein